MAKYTFTGSSGGDSSSQSSGSSDFEKVIQNISNTLKKTVQAVTDNLSNNMKSINRMVNISNIKINTFYRKLNIGVDRFFKRTAQLVAEQYKRITDYVTSDLTSAISSVFGDGLFGRYLKSALDWTSNLIFKYVGKAFSWITRSIYLHILRPINQFILKGVMAPLTKVFSSVTKTVSATFSKVGGILSKSLLSGKVLLIALIVAAIAGVVALIVNNIDKIWNWIKDLGKKIWDGITGFFTDLWNWIKNSALGRALGLNDEKSLDKQQIEALNDYETALKLGDQDAIDSSALSLYKVKKEKSTYDDILGKVNQSSNDLYASTKIDPETLQAVGSTPAVNIQNNTNNNMSNIMNPDMGNDAWIWGGQSKINDNQSLGISF